MRKTGLPEKVCVVCGRPFSWRKRWERNWKDVRICSERCRRNRGGRALRSALELPMDADRAG